MTKLEIAQEAADQIQRIESWWRKNRLAADLFMAELAEAFEALVAAPTLGMRHKTVRGITIRRRLLRQSHYHLYFSYDEERDLVTVRAVWHAVRGRPPPLR